MLSEAQRLRELAELYRELADLVIVGHQERWVLAGELEQRAALPEGTLGPDAPGEHKTRIDSLI